MWTSEFWKAALERAVRTAAQALVSVWLVGGVAFDVRAVDWGLSLGVAGGAAVLSLLTSIVGSQVGGPGPALGTETITPLTVNRHG